MLDAGLWILVEDPVFSGETRKLKIETGEEFFSFSIEQQISPGRFLNVYRTFF